MEIPDHQSGEPPIATRRWYMPAEWKPQSAIWVAWPHNPSTWPSNLKLAQTEFCRFVETIADTQPVYVLVGRPTFKEAKKRLSKTDHIRLIQIETNDAWTRDYGPTFLISDQSKQITAVQWKYNAWGGKYPPYELDQAGAVGIATEVDAELRQSQLCLEGGALEINESGTLLTTRSCVLNPNRNPDWEIGQIESELVAQLGATAIIWMAGHSIPGDDTDGHIDQLARFVSEDEIVYTWTVTSNDSRRQALAVNLASLQRSLVAHQLDYRLTPLNLPEPINLLGSTLPASYANFLITNRLVIVPQFGDPQDSAALQLLRDRFTSRDVVGLPSINLSVGLGSFHCLSQQQPVAGASRPATASIC